MPAHATLDQPRVIKSKPYYLSLFKVDELDEPPRGTVLMIHGGSWRGDLGPAADEVMAEWIERMHGWGYEIANLGYRGGADSLDDALAAFDLLRAQRGPDAPICLFGGSAGAHLALIVAARRGRSVDCVIDLVGPPSLVDWGSRPQSAAGLAAAEAAFGEDRLAALSPINNVDRIVSPVLVAAAPCDTFIELDQQREFVDALNQAGGDADLQVANTGDEVPFGHCAVTAQSFSDFEGVARRFLDGVSLEPAVVSPDEEEAVLGLLELLVAATLLTGVGVFAWWARRR